MVSDFRQWRHLSFGMNEVSLVSDNARSHHQRRPSPSTLYANKCKRSYFRRCISLPQDNRSRLPPSLPQRRVRRSSMDGMNSSSAVPTTTQAEHSSKAKPTTNDCAQDSMCRWTKIKISANKDVPPVLKRRLPFVETTISSAPHLPPPPLVMTLLPSRHQKANLDDKTTSPPCPSSQHWRSSATPLHSKLLLQQVLESMDDPCSIFRTHGNVADRDATEENEDNKDDLLLLVALTHSQDAACLLAVEGLQLE